jgi:hypothetical protein
MEHQRIKKEPRIPKAEVDQNTWFAFLLHNINILKDITGIVPAEYPIVACQSETVIPAQKEDVYKNK